MRVRELIELLKAQDPDAFVCARCWYDGDSGMLPVEQDVDSVLYGGPGVVVLAEGETKFERTGRP